MGARLLLDLLYKSELVDRESLLVALLLAELPTEEEIKRPYYIQCQLNKTYPQLSLGNNRCDHNNYNNRYDKDNYCDNHTCFLINHRRV